jgi:hypothetical protein
VPAPAADEVDELPSYDHLFGATQHGRPDPTVAHYIEPHDTDSISEPGIGRAPIEAAGGFTPAPAQQSDLTLPPPADTERAAAQRAEPVSPQPQRTSVAPTVPAAPAPVAPPAPGGLIDSVPWRSGGSNVAPPDSAAATSAAPAPAAPPVRPAGVHTPPPAPTLRPMGTPQPEQPVPPQPRAAAQPAPPVPSRPMPMTQPAPATQPQPTSAAPAPAVAPTPTEAADPSEATVPTEAAVPSSPPPPQRPDPGPAAPAPAQASAPVGQGLVGQGLVDDDAEATVDRSALLAAAQVESGPLVLAVLCPAGHPSPPHAGTCRSCGREIPAQQPFQTPRPPLGALRLASGDVVSLDRGVLLGRSPKVNADLPAADRPHLVRVPSPENDISRNHVEVVLEGWHVLVRDLGSTNGTTIALPGQVPVRLRAGDQQVIEPGTVITMADEVSVAFEVGA